MDWFGILGIARKISPNKDSPFTSKDLCKAVGFAETDQCSPDQIASAWICKFVKWGYAEKAGSIPNPGHKPLTTYILTKEGRDAEVELSDIDQLRDAVRDFEGARNTRQASMGKKGESKATEQEEEAWSKLLAICDRLDREEFGVE